MFPKLKFVLFFVVLIIFISSTYAFSKGDCELPRDVGPCYAYMLKYYFDAETKTCKSFTYGGCHGNNNRFDLKSECLAACS
ncbi:PI-actitoxin-Axm2a-like [Daktulosphaira vitifoliae]|uniref:PI-actitoxin-Axm2a-like n=1 Tax=Daktulosphaira vitifoliae TaxID=58002 RepID=UPI0021AAE6F1|nr:PI-actitoxin-Axm2a-like [Daktulosphaira vitifoliae]